MKAIIGLMALLLGTSAALASRLSAAEHRVELKLGLRLDGGVSTCRIVAHSDRSEQDALICPMFLERGVIRRSKEYMMSEIGTTFVWLDPISPIRSDNQPTAIALLLLPLPTYAWIRIEDYPDEILHGSSATVVAQVGVAPSGRVESCQVPDTGGEKALAAWTCRILTERRVYGHHANARGEAYHYKTASIFYWASDNIRVCELGEKCGPHMPIRRGTVNEMDN